MSRVADTPPSKAYATASLVASILLIVSGLLVYANSFGGVFLFDDHGNIVENEHIRSLWPPGAYLNLRRPVVQFTFAVSYAMSGLETWSYHLVNLAIHLLAALTLYGVVRRTILLVRHDRTSETSSVWLAFIVALLWMIHPLQTESVTYIIQRGESLMGLCYLLCLYAMIRGATGKRAWRWYAVAVVACALGMGCKAVMVTAPVVMVVFDRTFLSTSWRKLWQRRGVFYVCLFMTWAMLAMGKEATSVFQTTPQDGINVGFAYMGIDPVSYAMTQPLVLLRYLRLSLWPDTLCLDYQWPAVTSFTQAIGPALVVAALLLVTGVALSSRHWLGFAGAWFFLVLAPTSSFVPIKDVIFEHRMYLPLAAVIVVVVFAAYHVWQRLARKFASSPAGRSAIAVLVVSAVALPLGWRTVVRNRDYRSALAMWQSVLDVRPQSDRAHFGVGVALYREGRVDEAISQFEQAIALTPKYADAHFNLGVAYAAKDDWEAALTYYRSAVALAPNRVGYARTLGDTLNYLGRYEEAVPVFRDAVAAAPDDVDLRQKYADALADTGRYAEAVEAFEACLALDADRDDARINLGNALRRLGRVDEAIANYRRVLARNDRNAKAWANLGAACAGAGRFAEAEAALTRAVELDTDLVPAYRALVEVLVLEKKVPEARTRLQWYLERMPDDEWSRRKLGELEPGAATGGGEHGERHAP